MLYFTVPVLNVLSDNEEVGLDEPLDDLTVSLLPWWQFPGNRYRLERDRGGELVLNPSLEETDTQLSNEKLLTSKAVLIWLT